MKWECILIHSTTFVKIWGIVRINDLKLDEKTYREVYGKTLLNIFQLPQDPAVLPSTVPSSAS